MTRSVVVAVTVVETLELCGPRLEEAVADELDDPPIGVLVIDSRRTTYPRPV